MRIRDHVLFQYTLISTVITLLVMLLTAFWMGFSNRRSLIENHSAFYPRLILHMFENRNGMDGFSPLSGSISPRIEEHLKLLLEIESVQSVALYSPSGVQVWFQEKDHHDGHDSEESADDYMVFDIPVLSEAWKGGFVRISENSSILRSKIRRLVGGNLVIVIAAGLITYISLYGLYYRAYKKQKKTAEQILKTEEVTIFALAYQAGLRDEETGAHLKRTSEYVRLLASELARSMPYRKYLSRNYIQDLAKAAPLHDIGKVGVPDRILRKPGKLTADEFTEIKQHTLLGAKILEEAAAELSFTSFLDIAVKLVRNHHERWDGTGYPDGLSGENIPISARIMALADVYDALRSKRHYKEAFEHSKCIAIIKEGRGTHFDPMVVDAFLSIEAEFLRVSTSMKD